MRRKPKTFTLNDRAIKALSEEAKKQDRTKSQIVERLILKELTNENNQI